MIFSINFKANRRVLAVSTALTLTAMVSCQESNEFSSENIATQKTRAIVAGQTLDDQIQGDYEVREGTLHFRDLDAFAKVHKVLATANREQQLKFAQEAGFKSLLSVQVAFTKEAQQVQDGASYQKLLAKYSDIVSLDDTQTPTFHVQSSLLAAYQDRTGVVYIGKILYRFGDMNQTTVIDGDRAKLNSAESDMVQHSSHVPPQALARRSSICEFFLNKPYTNPANANYMSRMWVYIAYNRITQPNGQYTFMQTPFTENRSYRKTSGIWTLTNCSVRLYAKWTCTIYCTESGQPNGQSNPLISQPANQAGGTIISGNEDTIVYASASCTFSNVNNGDGGSLVTSFEFPTDNGWHEINGANGYPAFPAGGNIVNPMSCP